jgi:hypothetical protein
MGQIRAEVEGEWWCVSSILLILSQGSKLDPLSVMGGLLREFSRRD